MTLFDTLGRLESYLPILPRLEHVITVMDRALPYDNPDGSYKCPECDDVSYAVHSALSSDKGIPFEVEAGSHALIVALDGQEVVSSLDASSVFVMCEGRFVVLGPGSWKRAVAVSLPEAFRDVIFTF